MIRFYTFLIFILATSLLTGQDDWQEHFSHDRSAYEHIGQFVVDGNIVLLMGNWGGPMNTLETITGNSKKNAMVVSEYNEFLNIKTTTTGINEKEILLLNPWDYDITGLGVYSVRLINDAITTRDIQLIDGEYPFIYDAYIPSGALEPKEVISDYTNEWFTLDANDNIIGSVPLQNKFNFHETPNEVFQISGGILNPLFLPSDHPGNLNLGSYDRIDNDPYRNHIAIMTSSEMKRYHAETGELIRTDQLSTDPIDIIFTEEGFYYLSENEDRYTVYIYNDDLSQSEVWYELQKEGEIADFNVSNFEIIDDDIYFIGLIKRPGLLGEFSYVQKRNKNVTFAPNRKDVRIDSVYISGGPTGPDPWDFWHYDYGYKVTNTSDDTIHHFTILTPGMGAELGPFRLVYDNISQELAPGQSYEGKGEFWYYEQFFLTLTIAGVDFGFDRVPDTYTAEVMTLSSNDPKLNVYSIFPNPSSDQLFLKGEINEIKSIYISNSAGRQMEVVKDGINSVDISFLPKGQYWLEIRTVSHVEQHPFIKI